MSLFKADKPTQTLMPTVANIPRPDAGRLGLSAIDEEMRRRAIPPEEYAPKPRRNTAELGNLTMQAVKNFAELPTGQIDNLLMAVKDRIAAIEAKAEEIKGDYLRRITELQIEIERLNKACQQSEAKMGELHNDWTEIYRPRLEQRSKPVEMPHSDSEHG